MAVFVGLENPAAYNRQPASGDGGVDIMIEHPHGFEVLQVKGFVRPGGFDNNRRRQVTDSWKTLLTKPRLPKPKPVVSWRLVVPMDRTPDEEKWFNDLVSADAEARGIDYLYWGLPYWNGMASKFPQVVDYMLDGGRERVRMRADALLRSKPDVGQPITAEFVAVSLEQLRTALNRDDPHFSYEFRTDTAQPDPASIPKSWVLACAQPMDSGGYLTVGVIPNYRYALDIEPIEAKFEIAIPTADFRSAVEAFEKFGRPLDIPAGALSGELTAPGGLGTTITGGAGWFGASEIQSVPQHLRVVLLNPEDQEICELQLEKRSATRGAASGVELIFSDAAGTITFDWRFEPPDQPGPSFNLEVSFSDITGKPVEDVLPAALVFAHLGAPNALELRQQFGTDRVARAVLTDEPLFPAVSLRFLQDLSVLQRHAPKAILVPTDVDPQFAGDLRAHARMLEGESLTGTWDRFTLVVKPGADPVEVAKTFDEPGAFVAEEAKIVRFDGQDIPVGYFRSTLASIRVEEIKDDSLVLVPGDDATVTRAAFSKSFAESIE